MTQSDSSSAMASLRRAARHAVSVTPESTTGSRTGPTRKNWRPKKSPTVRSDSSWVATARTDWNRNEAQSFPAFQTSTGEKIASAIAAAAQGYGLFSQRPRHAGTSMNASTAGASIAAVNFDNSAKPANAPAGSHQRAFSLCASRTSAHTIATANGISATSGAT